MKIEFSEITHLIEVIIWPAAILVLLACYKKYIIQIISSFKGSFSKISFGNISIEFAKEEKSALSDFETSLENIRKPSFSQIDDSNMASFINQLQDTRHTDYAIVDIGTGQEWLTSRLYILSIILKRIKNIRYFVFVETKDGIFSKFLGIAEYNEIRWSLARQYSWFEKAYAGAYQTLFDSDIIVNEIGGIYEKANPSYPQMAINLANQFLMNIQNPAEKNPDNEGEWILLKKSQVEEHAEWISKEKLERLLGENLNRYSIDSRSFGKKSKAEQIREILLGNGKYVALVDMDNRFERLLDRSAVVHEILKDLVEKMN